MAKKFTTSLHAHVISMTPGCRWALRPLRLKKGSSRFVARNYNESPPSTLWIKLASIEGRLKDVTVDETGTLPSIPFYFSLPATAGHRVEEIQITEGMNIWVSEPTIVSDTFDLIGLTNLGAKLEVYWDYVATGVNRNGRYEIQLVED